MKQYFLKFDNEEQAKEVLSSYVSKNQWIDEAPVGSWIHSSKDHALDVLGTISKPTGETLIDGEGLESPVMAPIDGFYVNIAIDYLPGSLSAYVIYPATPNRLFAGVEVG